MDCRLPRDEDGLAPDRRLSRPATAATRHEGTALGLVALISLLALVLLSGWARLDAPAAWESDVIAALALGADGPAELVRALNRLGDLPVWAVLVGLTSAIVYVARGIVAGVFVALSAAGDLVAALVKALVERQRPPGALLEHFFGSESLAFPSGHVVRAVALVAALAWLFVPPPWRLPAALGGAVGAGVLMGYARVALGVHWPTDALGGMLLGVGWFALAAWLVARLQQPIG